MEEKDGQWVVPKPIGSWAPVMMLLGVTFTAAGGAKLGVKNKRGQTPPQSPEAGGQAREAHARTADLLRTLGVVE